MFIYHKVVNVPYSPQESNIILYFNYLKRYSYIGNHPIIDLIARAVSTMVLYMYNYSHFVCSGDLFYGRYIDSSSSTSQR